MLRNLLSGLAFLACTAALSGCSTPPPAASDAKPALPPGLIDIADTPGLPRNEAFQPVLPSRPAAEYPGADAARENARNAATEGMPAGKIAGGPKEELTIRPVEEPRGNTPLPPPPPPDERAKPVLDSRALRDLK